MIPVEVVVPLIVALVGFAGGALTFRAQSRKLTGDATASIAAGAADVVDAASTVIEQKDRQLEYMRQELRDVDKRLIMYRGLSRALWTQLVEEGLEPVEDLP